MFKGTNRVYCIKNATGDSIIKHIKLPVFLKKDIVVLPPFSAVYGWKLVFSPLSDTKMTALFLKTSTVSRNLGTLFLFSCSVKSDSF